MLSNEVPVNRRLLQCTSAIFWCLLSGGPIFGFAALKPILIKEKIYENVCEYSTNSSTSAWEKLVLDPSMFGSVSISVISSAFGISEDLSEAKCTAQDLKLNMMFTVAAMLTNVSALLIGTCLDNFGPKFCGLAGASFLYVACFIFMFSDIIKSRLSLFDPYLIGYASMALGGPFAFISSFQLSNSFPSKSGTILALITGAFDASSAIFLLYRIVYNATSESFTLDKFFKCYLFVPTFIAVMQILIMPNESYKTEPGTVLCQDDFGERSTTSIAAATETDALIGESLNSLTKHSRRDSIGDALKQPYALEGEEFLIEHSGGIFGVLHGFSAAYQLKTPWFFLMCLFTTIQMLRLNYFVATVGSQYSYLLDSISQSANLNRFFDIALPLGGIVAIPFIGIFLDYCSTVVVLATLLGVSLSIGILGLFPSFSAGVLNVSLFVVYRPFFYTTVSDYSAKVFGFDTFGTVYGSIICIAGVFNYLQSVLDKLTHTTFAMNPTPINIILVTLTFIAGLATVGYVRQQAVLYKKNKQVDHLHNV
ncbi:hypothetical protein METBIDRAFT_38364 [Metschnikowia bicuspidata var. bicuspidata NRRL YB-4993]|uniref:MFS general substrate transporter n=1 Tax=Metschnikowia bicuspidata var. bicuspidata NRRL YB-4993 TaxID=869754 RepID=A0A1A0HIC4_9ASCO|nr:hypothetical protein METBIDRAFT_38364 [Metschnikowia bicuspidata var. bicuspidata NRRL YB-4993]OBA23919.1 hypothetical protein METBIDRAFT_38364 [Metschnikowia bicuspidata var. bicuspidata NRRL YB-4993]